MKLRSYQLESARAIREAYGSGKELLICAPRGFGKTTLARAEPIKPQYPMAFPESVMPEVVREDIRDAIIDAINLRNNPPPADANGYEFEVFDVMGYSDPVRLPPLELEF